MGASLPKFAAGVLKAKELKMGRSTSPGMARWLRQNLSGVRRQCVTTSIMDEHPTAVIDGTKKNMPGFAMCVPDGSAPSLNKLVLDDELPNIGDAGGIRAELDQHAVHFDEYSKTTSAGDIMPVSSTFSTAHSTATKHILMVRT